MSSPEAIRFTQAIGRHARRQAAREHAPYRPDIGWVVHTSPLRVKGQGIGVAIDAEHLYFLDGIDTSSWQVGDKVALLQVGHQLIVLGRIHLGA